MHVTPDFTAPRRAARAVVAAALAALAAATLLGGVGALFQSRGAPLAQLAAAERACAHERYLSERQACMRRVIAAARTITVAAK